MSNRNREEQKLDRILKAVLYRRNCPDTMTLSDYQHGLLSVLEQAQLRAHVARCPHCQTELTHLTAFLSERPVAQGWIADLGFEWQRLVQTGRSAGQAAGRVIIRLVNEVMAPTPKPLPVRSLRDEPDGADIYRRIVLNPDQTGGLDLQAVVRRSQMVRNEWSLSVFAQVPSRWPELAGTVVRVKAGQWHSQAATNEDGQAIIDGIPDKLVDVLTIEVDPLLDSDLYPDPSLGFDPDSN